MALKIAWLVDSSGASFALIDSNGRYVAMVNGSLMTSAQRHRYADLFARAPELERENAELREKVARRDAALNQAKANLDLVVNVLGIKPTEHSVEAAWRVVDELAAHRILHGHLRDTLAAVYGGPLPNGDDDPRPAVAGPDGEAEDPPSWLELRRQLDDERMEVVFKRAAWQGAASARERLAVERDRLEEQHEVDLDRTDELRETIRTLRHTLDEIRRALGEPMATGTEVVARINEMVMAGRRRKP